MQNSDLNVVEQQSADYIDTYHPRNVFPISLISVCFSILLPVAIHIAISLTIPDHLYSLSLYLATPIAIIVNIFFCLLKLEMFLKTQKKKNNVDSTLLVIGAFVLLCTTLTYMFLGVLLLGHILFMKINFTNKHHETVCK